MSQIEEQVKPNCKRTVFLSFRLQFVSFLLIIHRFQWSFPEFNCCSFKLQVIWDKERKARYQIHIADRQSHKYFDDFTPEQELLKEWRVSPPDGKIIDCRFDKEWETTIYESGYAGTTRKGGWRFCRFRYVKMNSSNY